MSITLAWCGDLHPGSIETPSTPYVARLAQRLLQTHKDRSALKGVERLLVLRGKPADVVICSGYIIQSRILDYSDRPSKNYALHYK